jgi:ABC-type uncharacterized transport system permease subunit
MMTEQEGLRRMLAGPWWLGAVIALVCLTASLLILGLLALVVGGHPLQVLAALAEGSLGGSQAIGSTLKETVPIALCGLAFLIPFRAGFFNIGGQGQLEVGALAATALATWLTGPPAVVMSLALAAGGAGWHTSRSAPHPRGVFRVLVDASANGLRISPRRARRQSSGSPRRGHQR